jgi:hypothetical protein
MGPMTRADELSTRIDEMSAHEFQKGRNPSKPACATARGTSGGRGQGGDEVCDSSEGTGGEGSMSGLSGGRPSKVLNASTPEELRAIVGLIHDCWFDADEIRHDRECGVLIIRFTRPEPERKQRVASLGPLKKVEIPYMESFLRIGRVRVWQVEDRQQVGFYDFNELKYEPEKERLLVTSGVPFSLSVEVEDLDVTVEVTGRVAMVKARWSLFG